LSIRAALSSGALGDTGPGDAAVRTQEQHRLLAGVEPRFERAGAVTDHDDVGVVLVGPEQLGLRAQRDEDRAEELPGRKGPLAQNLRGWLFQHSTANQGPMTSSNRTFGASRVSTRGWMNRVPTPGAGGWLCTTAPCS
jgi:hypothetical protein